MKAKNIKTTWDLTYLYSSDDDPQMEKDRAIALKAHEIFAKKWKKDESYKKDPKKLLKALKEYEKLTIGVESGGNEEYYWHYRNVLEQDNDKVNAKKQDSQNFIEKLNDLVRFFTLEVGKIEKEDQERMLKYEPLTAYKHYLERIFASAPHRLTDREESILMKISRSSYENWTDMISKRFNSAEVEVLDDNQKKIKLPINSAMQYLDRRDDKIRETAGNALNKLCLEIAPYATEEVNSILHYKKVTDELRNFDRPDSSRILGDDIDKKFVDTLISAVEAHNHLANRYYKLKAKYLGKRKFNYQDKLASTGRINKKLPYGKAIDTIGGIFSSLDKQYGKIVKEYADGRIDVYPSKGKRGGAFANSGTDLVKGKVMLNYNDQITDISTVAHELGHGINHDMFKEKQSPLNWGGSMSVAEVASTFFEDLVEQAVLSEVSEEERLVLTFTNIEGFIASVFRQIAFYKIEQRLHHSFRDKGYLSEQEISDIYREELMEYLGPAFKFEKGADRTWVYVSHFRLFFYVYSYASGLLISQSLHSIRRDDQKYIDQINYFLSAGRSEAPIQIFKNMGIDLYDSKFWERGFERFEKQLDDLERMIG